MPWESKKILGTHIKLCVTLSVTVLHADRQLTDCFSPSLIKVSGVCTLACYSCQSVPSTVNHVWHSHFEFPYCITMVLHHNNCGYYYYKKFIHTLKTLLKECTVIRSIVLLKLCSSKEFLNYTKKCYSKWPPALVKHNLALCMVARVAFFMVSGLLCIWAAAFLIRITSSSIVADFSW